MVNIEIDGKQIRARDGAMVIEAADEAGITIPRFCYHKKLSIAANCRMCLVEVEKVAKPLPACATPVTEGMKVHTRSPRAISAQKAIMEFLLINHPLDCPICDQGGECDLQEMAMGYGRDVSRYTEGKRIVADKNIGPLIATDMTRCIHCTRCVRFGQEIAGMMELGAPGRGEHMRITTYLEHNVASELSGNVIDLCPVGALTSKPYRYTARPWELQHGDSVSPHDSVGSNLEVHTRNGRVMRVVPRENEAVNELWLADRDRFSYAGLYHADRLLAPKIKQDGRWQETDWDTALTTAARGLQKVHQTHGAAKLGALGADGATTEELFLLQKLMRGLGSGNVDHRLRQLDFRNQQLLPAFPWLGQDIAELEQVEAALLVGADVRKEQPLLAHRLRKAAFGAGARIMAINPVDFDFAFPVYERCVVSPADMVAELAAVARAAVELSDRPAPEGFNTFSAGAEVRESHRAMAQALQAADRATVLVGSLTAHHPAQADLLAMARLVAELTGATFGWLPPGGNSVGAALAGALPHRDSGGGASSIAGFDWRQMAANELKGFLLLGLEPDLDCIDGAALEAALQQAEFVVALSAFESDSLHEVADVLLPMAAFAETSGTFVNAEGRWQSFQGCAAAPGQARPGWKLLRVLGNLLDIPGFEYMSSEEVLAEVKRASEQLEPSSAIEWHCPEALAPRPDGLVRIVEYGLYAGDPLVRRSTPLQAAQGDGVAVARVHPTTAQELGLVGVREVVVQQGGYRAVMPLELDARIAPQGVYIPAGHPAGLGTAGEDPVVVLEPVHEQ